MKVLKNSSTIIIIVFYFRFLNLQPGQKLSKLLRIVVIYNFNYIHAFEYLSLPGQYSALPIYYFNIQ